MSDDDMQQEQPMIGPLLPTNEEWQRTFDAIREKLTPLVAVIQRICEVFADTYGDYAHDVQRQRITAAKKRARIVTRAKGSKRV